MKHKKIQKKITLNKQTIAALNPDEMNHQRGGTDSAPQLCSWDTFCETDCLPRSACNWTCPLSC
jgi:natural product precursor